MSVSRVSEGVPAKQHSMSNLWGDHVVKVDREPRDTSVNETIQKNGVQYWGGGSEATWYRKNKGYSNRINSCQ